MSPPNNRKGARVDDSYFALIADAVRRTFEPLNFDVYVSTNTHSMTVTQDEWASGEMDVHIKVRASG